MGAGSLTDTNIVVDFLAGVPQATTTIRSAQGRAISIVTWMEVLAGLRDGGQRIREVLESTFSII